MAGAAVGPYRILERLGAGANGEVFLAEDTRLHRRVALKTLSGTGGADAAELRRRLLREARAAARLNHPHIAAVYDVIESEEGVHIVMEYLPGTTLAATEQERCRIRAKECRVPAAGRTYTRCRWYVAGEEHGPDRRHRPA